MAKYRKKPVVVEAMQWDGTPQSVPDLCAWATPYGPCGPPLRVFYYDGTMRVSTLEGAIPADKGDWIIKGVKGELYLCKPDIFALTYEPVKEA